MRDRPDGRVADCGRSPKRSQRLTSTAPNVRVSSQVTSYLTQIRIFSRLVWVVHRVNRHAIWQETIH